MPGIPDIIDFSIGLFRIIWRDCDKVRCVSFYRRRNSLLTSSNFSGSEWMMTNKQLVEHRWKNRSDHSQYVPFMNSLKIGLFIISFIWGAKISARMKLDCHHHSTYCFHRFIHRWYFPVRTFHRAHEFFQFISIHTCLFQVILHHGGRVWCRLTIIAVTPSSDIDKQISTTKRSFPILARCRQSCSTCDQLNVWSKWLVNDKEISVVAQNFTESFTHHCKSKEKSRWLHWISCGRRIASRRSTWCVFDSFCVCRTKLIITLRCA